MTSAVTSRPFLVDLAKATLTALQDETAGLETVGKVDERVAPDADGTCYHGFALLQFNGGAVDVSYIDEYGGKFYKERFE